MSPQTCSCNCGSGVLAAVRKYLTSFSLLIPNNNVEQLFVRFSLYFLNIITCSVYIPPSSSIDLNLTYLNNIEFVVHQ